MQPVSQIDAKAKNVRAMVSADENATNGSLSTFTYLSSFSPGGQTLVSSGRAKLEHANGWYSLILSAYGLARTMMGTPIRSANT